MRDKVVLVTRKTALEELIERFGTHAQARFLLKSRGDSIDAAEAAHERYSQALRTVREAIPRGVRLHPIERTFLPNFLFGPADLVVTLGPDGLIVNTAKYLADQPLLAINPDPQRMDGVLIPFQDSAASIVLPQAIEDRLPSERITMAVARLDDGQSLHAVNDLFIGQRSHLSARYRIVHGHRDESQSSSGLIVSTGAGSSGWYRSILAGAAGVAAGVSGHDARWKENYRFSRTADELRFCVREPFTSKVSSAETVYGRIGPGECLTIVSQMAAGGVIFSDGIESDFLSFEAGRTATISVAERKVNLLVNARR
jgi:NAD kinase